MWKSDIATANAVTAWASQPRKRLRAPSSCSTNSSALGRRSAEINGSGAPPFSLDMSPPEKSRAARQVCRRRVAFLSKALALLDLVALFREVLERARMERHRRVRVELVAHLEGQRFLVHLAP